MKIAYVVTGAIVVALITTGIIFALNRSTKQPVVATVTSPRATSTTPAGEVSPQTIPPATTFTFGTPKKAAHFETSTPSHEQVLAAVPINVVIDFNFDLAAPSEISIKNDGQEYGQGETTIDTNKLGLRRAINSAAPDGIYTVTYKACWPDKSCHDGTFSFAIERTSASRYKDLTNQKEVTIHMSNSEFQSKDVKISKGTKVTWVNDDQATHYVNTDSHPAHTYHAAQNSKALEKGDSYSVSFDTPGAYPYHCSAHASTMVGNIIVE